MAVDVLRVLVSELQNRYGIDAKTLLEALKVDKPAEEITITLDRGTNQLVPAGVYLISAPSVVVLEYSPDGGTTWRTVGTPTGIVISDGKSVRLSNTDTVNPQTVYLLKFI